MEAASLKGSLLYNRKFERFSSEDDALWLMDISMKLNSQSSVGQPRTESESRPQLSDLRQEGNQVHAVHS